MLQLLSQSTNVLRMGETGHLVVVLDPIMQSGQVCSGMNMNDHP